MLKILFKSMYGVTIGRSQSTRWDSKHLLKNAVLNMFLRSSKLFGGWTFGNGIWNSCTHWHGYSIFLRMLLKIIVTGVVNSTENSFTTFFVISPGILEFSFFDLHIIRWCIRHIPLEMILNHYYLPFDCSSQGHSLMLE